MSKRNKSAESVDEFFESTRTENDDEDKKPKQSDIPTTSAIASPIKSNPLIHHRRTSPQAKATTNSKTMPLTTNIKTSKLIESPPSKKYDSDFDDTASIDEKQKHSSLPPPKEHSPRTPRRGSDSKLKAVYMGTNHNTRRKGNHLPSIRSKNRTKRLQKETTKNEIEQRLLSAQNDKLNKLQSRLTELRLRLEQERLENKTLRSIQKREEHVLQQYEDQEYNVHRLANDYTHDIEDVKGKIELERENKFELEKEIEDRSEILRDQTKRMKFYEKLIHEPNLDEPEKLREKLKETDKKLQKYQDKIANKQKIIDNLEKNHRQEIHQELVKQRDLKHEIENHTKKYTDLLLRFEEKTRQVGTMHIYIQRGGRRPSISSIDLSKTRSFQSFEDTSPRFREKIAEYDKKRREEVRLKPKPKLKPLPLPDSPPAKRERKKYVSSIVLKPKPKPTKTSSPPVHEEKPPIIENEQLPPKVKPPVRRLSTPPSIDEDKSEKEDETIIKPTRQKPPWQPTGTIQRTEQHLPEAPVQKQPPIPVSPSVEPKLSTGGSTTTSSLFKDKEPLPPAKPPVTRKFDDKWPDIFDLDKTEESTKDDLLSKLVPHQQQEKKIVITTKPSPPSSQHPSMIMFEPSSITTNGPQKKTPIRPTTNNIYDFEQAVINLHDGKPVTAQPTTTTTTKTSVDSFENLFDNNITESTNRLTGRDDTFTTTKDESDPFDSIFIQPTSAANTSTAIKSNLRSIPSQNDKLQRPKIVTSVPKPIPNRTVVEEIEEFVV